MIPGLRKCHDPVVDYFCNLGKLNANGDSIFHPGGNCPVPGRGLDSESCRDRHRAAAGTPQYCLFRHFAGHGAIIFCINSSPYQSVAIFGSVSTYVIFSLVG